MTHTTEQLAAFSATTAAEQLIIKNAISRLMDERNYGTPEIGPASDDMANLQEEQRTAAVLARDEGFEDYPVDLTTKPADPADENPIKKPTMDAVRKSRVFKINSTKVDPALLALFEDIMSRAVAEKISGIKAVQMVLAAQPQATRVAIKHTAALVGINPLSARNTYDHFKNDKN